MVFELAGVGVEGHVGLGAQVRAKRAAGGEVAVPQGRALVTRASLQCAGGVGAIEHHADIPVTVRRALGVGGCGQQPAGSRQQGGQGAT